MLLHPYYTYYVLTSYFTKLRELKYKVFFLLSCSSFFHFYSLNTMKTNFLTNCYYFLNHNYGTDFKI